MGRNEKTRNNCLNTAYMTFWIAAIGQIVTCQPRHQIRSGFPLHEDSGKPKGVTIASFFSRATAPTIEGAVKKLSVFGGEEENGVQAVQLK
ncbi:hypothetical protein T10_1450 [Trichinella papuae]|uniref:Uncharacterized protein n=1 Tax=Trichinella papuae TaxID=268474 RepID=A0A0V1MLH2_9BILA|nr:hypothetical protein T10_1450 [Trichinella papuae]